jgi:hypothetical protein
MTNANGWRPISTAPEDEWVLIAIHDGTVGEAYWLADEETGAQIWFWAGNTPVRYNHRPTHWQPLPPPPAQEGGEDG